MKRDAAIAIDPGVSGGFAWGWPGNVKAAPMPETVRDMIDQLESIRMELAKSGFPSPPVVMERQTGGWAPGSRIPTARAFAFGRNYGALEGAVMALGMRLELPTAQQWQKAVGVGTKSGLTPAEWKRKLRAEAQRLFPEVNITLKTADALLILEFYHRPVSA